MCRGSSSINCVELLIVYPTTRCAEASERIQLLPVEAWGLLQSEYIETAKKGSMSGAETRATASEPGRLTAKSFPVASSSDLASIHSTLTRCESLATAVRHGREASVPAVDQDASSTSTRPATSCGGSAASCRSAMSASISARMRHDSGLRRTFQETIFTVNGQTYEESSREQGRDPGEAIADLLGPDEAASAERFWDEVARNLAASRLRLLFVADEIPEPLKRVAEFLNAQMAGVEVLAVEVKRFRGGGAQTLVPRVFGSTGASRSGTRPPRLTRELFLVSTSPSRRSGRRLSGCLMPR